MKYTSQHNLLNSIELVLAKQHHIHINSCKEVYFLSNNSGVKVTLVTSKKTISKMPTKRRTQKEITTCHTCYINSQLPQESTYMDFLFNSSNFQKLSNCRQSITPQNCKNLQKKHKKIKNLKRFTLNYKFLHKKNSEKDTSQKKKRN